MIARAGPKVNDDETDVLDFYAVGAMVGAVLVRTAFADAQLPDDQLAERALALGARAGVFRALREMKGARP